MNQKNIFKTLLALVIIIVLISIIYLFLSQRKNETAKKELTVLRSEIENVIDTTASDVNSCEFIGIGHAPCGGPVRYQVYSTEPTDVSKLEELSSAYYNKQKEYNETNNISGNCMVPPRPNIDLIDGHCVSSAYNESKIEDDVVEDTSSILEGKWFTPHAALRSITILETNRFIFNEWDDISYEGSYNFDGRVLTLGFDDPDKEDLILNYETDDLYLSQYLKNDVKGEYFLKQTTSQNLLETGESTVCQSNEDCWCRRFNGAEFLSGKSSSSCNQETDRCEHCYYR